MPVTVGNPLELLNLSSDPTGAAGYAYFNTTLKTVRLHDGTGWRSIGPQAIPAAVAYRTAVQSIPQLAWVPITLDTEEYDSDGIHSTSSNTSRFTCATPAVYVCSGSVPLVASSAGLQRIACWLKNGNVFYGIQGAPFGASINSWMSAHAIVALNAGDYMEFCVFQDTGGNLNTGAAPSTPARGGMALQGSTGGTD